MKKNVKVVCTCPICGNELPWSVIASKLKILKCPYCKNTFNRWEIVKEKESKND